MLYFLFGFAKSLSYVCDFPEIEGPVSSHFLYKEDNVNEVKWLERYEYCRAKGDTSVYFDAGQGKCEYSRGICVWNNGECVISTDRGNDSLDECKQLLQDNILVEGLDSGRSVQPSEEPEEPEEEVVEPTEPEEQVVEPEEPEFDAYEVEEPRGYCVLYN